MFNEAARQKLIEYSQQDRANLERTLRKFREERNKLERESDRIHSYMMGKDLKNLAVSKALAKHNDPNAEGETAQTILLDEALTAIKLSKEFDYPPYIEGLTRAIFWDIFSARILNYQIIIDIDLDKSAGTLEQYGNAIKAARADYMRRNKAKGGQGTLPAIKASQMFYEKIYSVARLGGTVTRQKINKKTGEITTVDVTSKYRGKYEKTIADRISHFGSGSAPWWRILEYGNTFVKLSSDRGGVGLPHIPATHFVQKAKIRIAQMISDSYHKFYDQSWSKWKAHATRTGNKLNKINEDIRVIEELLKSPESKKYATVYRRLSEKLEPVRKEVDWNKVMNLSKQLVQGDAPERIRLGGGVRIRLTNIIRELEIEFRLIEIGEL